MRTGQVWGWWAQAVGNSEKPLEAQAVAPKAGLCLVAMKMSNQNWYVSRSSKQFLGFQGNSSGPTQPRKLCSSPCGFGEVSPDISSGSGSRLRLWPEFCGTS